MINYSLTITVQVLLVVMGVLQSMILVLVFHTLLLVLYETLYATCMRFDTGMIPSTMYSISGTPP